MPYKNKEDRLAYQRKRYATDSSYRKLHYESTQKWLEKNPLKKKEYAEKYKGKYKGKYKTPLVNYKEKYQKRRDKILKKNKMLYSTNEEYRLKAKARSAVSNAIKAGKLKKLPCVVCNQQEKIHAHHSDYSRPLEVIWLCRGCHLLVHSGQWNPTKNVEVV